MSIWTGDTDAHYSFDNSDGCGGFDGGAGSGPDLWVELSCLLAGLWPKRELHRLRLCLAGAVQSVGIWPRRAMYRESIFCGRRTARWLAFPAASQRLLKILPSRSG